MPLVTQASMIMFVSQLHWKH